MAMNKLEAIAALVKALKPDDLIVCCNGMIGRELFTVANRPQNFYMIGSMGLALSIGLGVALSRPKRHIVVLDGDGNVLMGMSSLASVGHERPPNLLHVVLDNGVHASTGGQRTISGDVHLESVAGAAGYRSTHRAREVQDFATAIATARRQVGPVMVIGEVLPGNQPGIARVEPTPPELARIFAAEARR